LWQPQDAAVTADPLDASRQNIGSVMSWQGGTTIQARATAASGHLKQQQITAHQANNSPIISLANCQHG
jgi:hypothetical protein